MADLGAMADASGTAWLDLRAASLSGTRLSNRACLAVAREMTCCWIPAVALPPIKCVALDLDGTLHDGAIGEEGTKDIVVTDEHRRLQEYVASLRQRGILLALVSRNEPGDVAALFGTRTDYPLRGDDFDAVEVSWDSKAQALGRIAERLRIGADAIVFVDDNPGELAEVAEATPAVTVHASPDASLTLEALSHVAGLFRWKVTEEDRLRAIDLSASVERDRFARNASADEYLRSLQVRLTYRMGRDVDLARAADLARRANQFNLALRRMGESQLAARVDADPGAVVSIALSDRLSDSGVIALVVGRCEGPVLRVEELVVSCRALGRRIEDAMLREAIRLMVGQRHVTCMEFDVATGPRNAPARDWLAGVAGRNAESGVMALPVDVVIRRPRPDAVEWVVRSAEVAA